MFKCWVNCRITGELMNYQWTFELQVRDPRNRATHGKIQWFYMTKMLHKHCLHVGTFLFHLWDGKTNTYINSMTWPGSRAGPSKTPLKPKENKKISKESLKNHLKKQKLSTHYTLYT